MENPLSDFLRSFLTVGLFAALAVVLFGLLVGISALLRPDRKQAQKYIAYESGADPVGSMWSQSQVRYYVYGFLFVIFDVESVFLFPWAKVFESLGYQAVGSMALFIGILAVGLLYAYRKGVLRWA